MRLREKQIVFRTTYEEYKEIKIRAEKVGLNLSDYIRNRAVGFEPREKPPKEFYEAIKQIRMIGNNINQITRLANETGILDELTYKISCSFFGSKNSFLISIINSFNLSNCCLQVSSSNIPVSLASLVI